MGGTPCQSFSIAGKRKGFEDTRGTVFFSYVNAVKNVEPKYFIFENVKGLISHDKGNTIRTMLLAFDEIGYELDFDVLILNAMECHKTEKEFISLEERKTKTISITGNKTYSNIFEVIV